MSEHQNPDCSPPLTEDQLNFFTEQTRKVVVKIQRRWARGAVVGFLILFAGSLGAYKAGQDSAKQSRRAIIQSGTAISVAGCNRDYKFSKAVRGVLMAAQDALTEQYNQGLIDEPRYIAAKAFYVDQLHRLTVPDCREAATILTEDPNEVPSVPTPLHDGE